MLQQVSDFLKKNTRVIGLVVIASLVVYISYKYTLAKKEGMENTGEVVAQGVPLLGDEFPVQSDTLEMEMMAESLLPKSAEAEEFEKQFPVGTGDLSSKNFLAAGHNIGVNTVSSSLRNPNLQLRSDPFIEPRMVSPFLNSTITPDLNRKSFEIGK